MLVILFQFAFILFQVINMFFYMDLVLVTLQRGGGGGGGGAGWHLNIYINNAKDVNDKYP